MRRLNQTDTDTTADVTPSALPLEPTGELMRLDLTTFVNENTTACESMNRQLAPPVSSSQWNTPYTVRIDRVVADKFGFRYHVLSYVTLDKGAITNFECTVDPMSD